MNRWLVTFTTIIMAAVLFKVLPAVVGLPGSPGPAAVHPADGTPTGMLGAFRTMDDMLLEVAEIVPGFGGMYVDESEQTLFVYSRHGDDSAALRQAIVDVFGPDILPPGWRVQVLNGTYTMSQLSEWYRLMADHIWQFEGVTATDLQEAGNHLWIAVEDDSVRALVERELDRLDIPLDAVVFKVSAPVRETVLAACNGGVPATDPAEEGSFRLIPSWTAVRAGEEIKITIAMEGRDLENVTRGVDSYLECWNGKGWTTINMLLTGEQPSFYPYPSGTPIIDIGLGGPGPERVRLPADLEPGWYRIRKEFSLEDEGFGRSQTAYVRLRVVRDESITRPLTLPCEPKLTDISREEDEEELGPLRPFRLALSPTEVQAGEEITIRIESYEPAIITRGSVSHLACWDGAMWVRKYVLISPGPSDGKPSTHPYPLEGWEERPVVGGDGRPMWPAGTELPGPGPDTIRLPDDIEPGWYQISKSFWNEDSRMFRKVYALLRVVPRLDTKTDDRNGGAFLAETRQSLQICVDTANVPLQGIEAVQTVKDTLRPLQSHPRWSELGYGEFSVVAGCPQRGYLTYDENEHPWLSGSPDAAGRTVTEASPYRVWVIVVPPATIQRHFNNTEWRTAPEEMLCDRGQCVEVSTGVYVTMQEMVPHGALDKGLKQALALEFPGNPPAPSPQNLVN